MDKKNVIVGNGSYARMMNEYLKMSGWDKTYAYVVDAPYIEDAQIDGIPVISFEQLKADYPCEQYDLIMGIGYVQMGNLRKRIFEQCKSWGYHFKNYIHPTAIIEKNVQMGEGNNILEGVILEAGVCLGNANLLFGGSVIAHETVVGSYNTFSVRAVVAGCTSIDDNCFFGAASVVKDHVVLKDYVLVGAAAYGYRDLEAYSVVVPAKSEIRKDKKSTDYL